MQRTRPTKARKAAATGAPPAKVARRKPAVQTARPTEVLQRGSEY